LTKLVYLLGRDGLTRNHVLAKVTR
jgi:hypothetical protein